MKPFSALARSTKFAQAVADCRGASDMRIVEFQGALIPLVKAHGVWSTISEWSCGCWFESQNGVDFSIPAFADHFKETVFFGDCCPFYDFELTAENTWQFPTALFELPVPATVDGYVASLDKYDRSDWRRANRDADAAGLTWKAIDSDTPWTSRYGDIYEWKITKRFNTPLKEAPIRRRVFDCVVKHMKEAGVLQCVGAYQGDKLMGVNFSENTGSIVHDYASLWEPDCTLKTMGRIVINQNIMESMKRGAAWYNLGHVWPEKREGCDFSYKLTWLPKVRRATPFQSRNFAAFWNETPAECRERYMANGGDSGMAIYPPYYQNGRLVLE